MTKLSKTNLTRTLNICIRQDWGFLNEAMHFLEDNEKTYHFASNICKIFNTMHLHTFNSVDFCYENKTIQSREKWPRKRLHIITLQKIVVKFMGFKSVSASSPKETLINRVTLGSNPLRIKTDDNALYQM